MQPHGQSLWNRCKKKKKTQEAIEYRYQVVVQGRETNFLRLGKLLKNKTPNNTTNLRGKKSEPKFAIMCYVKWAVSNQKNMIYAKKKESITNI